MNNVLSRALPCLLLLWLTACGGGSDSPPAGSALPVASAGAARSVAPGTTVTLYGSASRDPQGAALSYAWTLAGRPTGSAATLAQAGTAAPTFVADLAGSYTASLVVSSAGGSSVPSAVTITAASNNASPSARAGSAQNVLLNATVQLDGTASTDSDGDALSYVWTLIVRPAASSATLANATSPQPSFRADTVGSYTAALVVNDGKASSLTSLVTVTASAGNAAPVARAGADQGVVLGNTVRLNGSGSSDANDDRLTYRWTISARPTGSSATLVDATQAQPSFGADAIGLFEVTLVVNDGTLDSAPATVTVTASNANLAPVADAGAAQQVAIGARVTLDGAASTDPNGDRLTFLWSLTSRPAGSAAALAGRTAAQVDFVADVEGLYVASLVVNDSKADSPGATVAISARILPLAAGAGTFVQERAGRPFHAVDETSGDSTPQAASCAVLGAADARPDGVVLATVPGSTQLRLVDVKSGPCKLHFAVAEPMVALAVASDGSVWLVSEAATSGARQLYRYSEDGRLLARLPLSGTSTAPGVVGLTAPQAMDLAPDGTLLVLQGDALWQVDPVTGTGTLRATGLAGSGDIDIDATGLLRTVDAGQLRIYSAATGAPVGTVTLQRDLFGPSALLRR